MSFLGLVHENLLIGLGVYVSARCLDAMEEECLILLRRRVEHHMEYLSELKRLSVRQSY